MLFSSRQTQASMCTRSAVTEVYTRCLGAHSGEGELGPGVALKVVLFTGINANSGASGENEVGAFAGREGIRYSLSEFPQVTMKGVRRKTF